MDAYPGPLVMCIVSESKMGVPFKGSCGWCCENVEVEKSISLFFHNFARSDLEYPQISVK